jgi:hypothetical protein
MFVSLTIYHKVQGADLGATTYASIKRAYKLHLKTNPSTSIQALYEEEGEQTKAMAPIKQLHDLPSDILGLANFM